MSLGIIVLLMGVAVAGTGLCSFNQDRKGQPVTIADASVFISMESSSLSYPLRVPQVPQDWTCTVARRISLGDASYAPLLGWLTPDSHYVQLIQTDKTGQETYDRIDSKTREFSETRDYGSYTVDVYTGEEPLWVTTTPDGVTLLVSGIASDEDFQALIEATLHTEPVVRS